MPSQVATAYVQIIPSAQGIGNGIAQALGGDAAATSAGESIGGKLVGAIKGVIAAAGIGAALTKTITEGAALEQSLDGVKTLFKDSAGQVIANAEKAYRTAGVSANSYMEQVTSFSATLLQGLGGDTRAAAAMADQALVQMSDNANKFGTDMASIQYAYQGFAKQNYTMLDNLKLGYGGTQSEMARLINDSGVLGDSIEVTAQTVKDVPFDKIIQAIGVIQDDLGITGTTAKEAATTLSGSFASMQAAASNVLANLTLGRDIGPSLTALATTTKTFLVDNLLPAVWNILKTLPGALVAFVKELGPQLAEGMGSFIPQVMEVGKQTIQSLGDGLAAGLPAFLAQALPMVLQFTENLRANFGSVVDAGIQLLLNLAKGIANALPTLIEYVPQIVTNIAGLINDNAPKILQAGIQIIGTLVMGILQSIPTLLMNVLQIVLAIVSVVTAFNWIHLGATVMTKLGQGITSMAGGIKNAVTNGMRGAIDFIKALPSQALKWGKDLIQGLINGIKSKMKDVIGAVADVAGAITSFLHFSRPDVGPLRMYEEWMPDMMSGLAQGIRSNLYQVTDAVSLMGGSMAKAVQENTAQAARLRWAIGSGAGPVGQETEAKAEPPVSIIQHIHFHYPVQAPDEIARTTRIETTRGLAGAR